MTTKPGGYWEGVDADAERAGIADGWGAGGVFGTDGVAASEILEELNGDEFEGGQEGVRSRPGYGNLLGAQETVADRNRRAHRRARMLVVERLIDEMPELRDKVFESFGKDGIKGWLRRKIVEQISPVKSVEVFETSTSASTSGWTHTDTVTPSIRSAVAARAKEEAFNVLAEIYRRAYHKELRRVEGAVRLGAFEPEEWAAGRAQAALESHRHVAAAAAERVRSVVERLRHTVHTMTAPAGSATSPAPEKKNEEDE